MSVAAEIEANLRAAFAPDALTVEDQSERHRGHAGWREGGETHFHLRISAAPFSGMTRVARQRAVHAAIGGDLVARIHALSMEFVDA